MTTKDDLLVSLAERFKDGIPASALAELLASADSLRYGRVELARWLREAASDLTRAAGSFSALADRIEEGRGW